MIYPISDSPWVSPVHVVPKKGGMTVVRTEQNELIPTKTVTGWRMCIDYRRLNTATRKYHFPLPFMDQMLEGCRANNSIVFWMVIPGIIKLQWTRMTMRKRHSLVLSKFLPTGRCCLVYATLRQRFNVVFKLFSPILLKRRWRSLWMTSPFSEHLSIFV